MKKIILYTLIVLFLTSCGFSNKGLIDSTKVSNIEITGKNNVIEDKNEKIEEIVPMSYEYIALMKNKSIEKWKGSKLEEIDGWVDIQMKNYITQNVELTQKKEESLKDKIILKDYGNGFKLMYSDTKVYIFHNGNNIFEKNISLFFLTLDCKKLGSCPTTLNSKSLKALKIYTNRAIGLKHFSGNFYVINENMYEGSYSYFYDSKNIKIFKEKGDVSLLGHYKKKDFYIYRVSSFGGYSTIKIIDTKGNIKQLHRDQDSGPDGSGYIQYIDTEFSGNNIMFINYYAGGGLYKKKIKKIINLDNITFSDKLKSNLNICIRENEESIYKKYGFPEPKQLDLKLDFLDPECPAENNVSKIYFDRSANNASAIISKGDYTLKGKVLNNAEKIEIIWDGDMESYFLKEYIPGEKYFQYNISLKFGNIKVGKNKYLIRVYSMHGIYERVYTLDYYSTSEAIFLEEDKEKNSEGKYDNIFGDLNIGYVKNENTYSLGISHGKYILNLGDTQIEFLHSSRTVFGNDNPDSYVKVLADGKEASLNGYASYNYRITTYDSGDLLFSTRGYESPINYVYYSKKFNKFFYVFNMIRENLKVNNYYNTTKIENNYLIIKSLKNPWKKGTYELKMNLDTLKITK